MILNILHSFLSFFTNSLVEQSDITEILYLIIPLAIFGVWVLHNIIFCDNLHILIAMGTQDSTRNLRDLKLKTVAQLAYIGGTLAFPFLFKMVLTSRKKKLLALFSFLCGLFIYYRLINNYEHSHINAILCAIFISTTIYYLLSLPLIQSIFWNLIGKNKSARNIDDYFLIFWFSLIFIFNIMLWFVAVKYILLLLPPWLILFCKQLDDVKSIVKEKYNFYLTTIVVLTCVLGFPVAGADYKYTNAYNKVASKLAQEYEAESNAIWFVGHWGFKYYMKKMGFKHYEEDSY